ncbi:MAG: sulfur carrier protein ThiS [bacterium]|nr:sulfur carrier protein ThiS [bacterium]
MNVRITINGETSEVPAGSVADLVEHLGLRPEQVAVEVNKDLIVRDARERTTLAEGDRVELVTLVGGG